MSHRRPTSIWARRGSLWYLVLNLGISCHSSKFQPASTPPAPTESRLSKCKSSRSCLGASYRRLLEHSPVERPRSWPTRLGPGKGLLQSPPSREFPSLLSRFCSLLSPSVLLSCQLIVFCRQPCSFLPGPAFLSCKLRTRAALNSC